MSTVSTDYEAVAHVVRDYVNGMSLGDPARIAAAMHPRAHSIGLYAGGLEWDARDAFAEACRAAADGAGIVPPWTIDAISVAGDTATVRTTNIFAGQRYLDSLTLVRIEGRWQIVNKVFQHLGPA